MAIRFNVFGTLVVIARRGNEWLPYYGGVNGTKRPADFVIPSDIQDGDLEQYLGDLFHEHARPNNDAVIRLDSLSASP